MNIKEFKRKIKAGPDDPTKKKKKSKYQIALELIAKEKGFEPDNFKEYQKQVRYLESKDDYNSIQKPRKDFREAPGRGAYQYEVSTSGGSGSSLTAIKRAKQWAKDNDFELPEDLNEDFSKMSPESQDLVDLLNYRKAPSGDFTKIKNKNYKDAYLNHHWAGSKDDYIKKAKYYDETIETMGKKDKTKLAFGGDPTDPPKKGDPIKGQPTTQDSLDLYNINNTVLENLKKEGFKISYGSRENTDIKTQIKIAEEDLNAELDYAKKAGDSKLLSRSGTKKDYKNKKGNLIGYSDWIAGGDDDIGRDKIYGHPGIDSQGFYDYKKDNSDGSAISIAGPLYHPLAIKPNKTKAEKKEWDRINALSDGDFHKEANKKLFYTTDINNTISKSKPNPIPRKLIKALSNLNTTTKDLKAPSRNLISPKLNDPNYYDNEFIKEDKSIPGTSFVQKKRKSDNQYVTVAKQNIDGTRLHNGQKMTREFQLGTKGYADYKNAKIANKEKYQDFLDMNKKNKKKLALGDYLSLGQSALQIGTALKGALDNAKLKNEMDLSSTNNPYGTMEKGGYSINPALKDVLTGKKKLEKGGSTESSGMKNYVGPSHKDGGININQDGKIGPDGPEVEGNEKAYTFKDGSTYVFPTKMKAEIEKIENKYKDNDSIAEATKDIKLKMLAKRNEKSKVIDNSNKLALGGNLGDPTTMEKIKRAIDNGNYGNVQPLPLKDFRVKSNMSVENAMRDSTRAQPSFVDKLSKSLKGLKFEDSIENLSNIKSITDSATTLLGAGNVKRRGNTRAGESEALMESTLGFDNKALENKLIGASNTAYKKLRNSNRGLGTLNANIAQVAVNEGQSRAELELQKDSINTSKATNVANFKYQLGREQKIDSSTFDQIDNQNKAGTANAASQIIEDRITLQKYKDNKETQDGMNRLALSIVSSKNPNFKFEDGILERIASNSLTEEDLKQLAKFTK